MGLEDSTGEEESGKYVALGDYRASNSKRAVEILDERRATLNE